jgi:photosystem II stability/assembly factor-like uncharacterized protein
MRARIAPSLVLLAFVGGGPATPPPEPPKPAPKPVATTLPKPEPTHATWRFQSPAGVAHAQVSLGDKGTLQVGQRGRRWLFDKAGSEPKQATTLAPQDLVDARVEGTKILLLGEEGEVFTVSDPLGPIESTKPSPKDQKAFAFRAGKQALLGLEKDGSLLRSTDAGGTWTKTKVPMRPGDVAVALATNKKGEALVLIHPQRVLFSSDDGATWAQIGTPGIGATALLRDANDDLFLRGASYEKYAKLSSGKLEGKDQKPIALMQRTTDEQMKKSWNTRRVLAGNRLVSIIETPSPTTKFKKLEVAVAPLSGELPPPTVLEPAMPKWGARVMAAGHESSVVLALIDEQSDPPATKFIRTNDDGKTWDQLGTLTGRLGWSFPIFAGPNWIVVGEVCDEETKTCKPASAKVGNGEWQEIPLQPKSTLSAVEFDAAHDRVWILASSGDTPVLLTSKLKEANFTASGVELPRGTPRAATVDAKGWLRLAYPGPTRIMRVAPDLGVHPSLYLPFQAYDIDLIGDRGFAYDGDDAYETADGGEKWLKVAGATSGPVQCTTTGCVQGGVVRVGWELPSDGATLVPATNVAPPKTKKGAESDYDDYEDGYPPAFAKPTSGGSSAPPPPPLRLSCTPTGAWKPFDATLDASPADVALDGDVRFSYSSWGKEGALSLPVARGSAAPTSVKVIGPDPKRKPNDTIRDRHWTQKNHEGFIAVRYSFSTEFKDGESKYQPVDVELGWYATASGKTAKAKLDKVPAFRVGQSSASAMHAIVDGGLLFLPNNGDAPLYFVHENGKVENMPRPPTEDGGYTDAVKLGNKVVLARFRYGDVTLASTTDAGKTWSTVTWTLGVGSSLAAVDGKPTLVLGQSLYAMNTAPSSLISIDAFANDPPEAVRIDLAKLQIGDKSFAACTPKMRQGLRVELASSRERRSVLVSMVPDKNDKEKDPKSLYMSGMPLRMLSQISRIDSTGNACTDGVLASEMYGGGQNAVITPHDLGKSWLLRRVSGNYQKLETRALSCKAE